MHRQIATVRVEYLLKKVLEIEEILNIRSRLGKTYTQEVNNVSGIVRDSNHEIRATIDRIVIIHVLCIRLQRKKNVFKCTNRKVHEKLIDESHGIG